MRVALSAGATLALSLVATAAGAASLPKTIAWTAYDVGASGYSQAVAIGAALKNERGITLRVLPGKNDVSRTIPLREDKVLFSAGGYTGPFQALEATYVFGEREWGPQRIRILAMSKGDDCSVLMFAGDAGVKTLADLKGKRLPTVIGAPSLVTLLYAYVRFAGYDWSDVRLVEFGGYASHVDGLMNGQVDAVLLQSSSGQAQKVTTGPRGYAYMTVPHADREGWARLQQVAPFYTPHVCTEGAGITGPLEVLGFPYPALTAYERVDAGMAYDMTRAIFELYPLYKDSAPGAKGWGLERQLMEPVLPFHEGAIRYYKEAGRWTPAAQANQDRLLERERLVHAAWTAYLTGAPADKEGFAKGWMKARAEVLDKAGLHPVWRTW